MHHSKTLIGLLYKDLLMLKNASLYYLVICVFFFAIALATNSPLLLMSYLAALLSIIVINCTNYDEAYHWDRYVLTMPVSRRMVVQSKYLLVLVITVPILMLSTLCSVLSGNDLFGSFLSALSSIGTILILLMFTMPFLLRFGRQKGNVFFIVIVMLAAVSVVLGATIIESAGAVSFFAALSDSPLFAWIVIGILLLVMALLIAGSYLLACKLYENKEF